MPRTGCDGGRTRLVDGRQPDNPPSNRLADRQLIRKCSLAIEGRTRLLDLPVMNVAMSCRRALAVSLGVIALSASAGAQVTGSINEKAPRLSTRIDFANGSMVELRYTAIAYGKGSWRMLPGRKSQHAEFNANATRKPIGTVTTTTHVIACGNVIPPGRYDLYFTINADQCWELNLRRQRGEEPIPIIWHMHAKPTRALHKRLRLALEPTKETHLVSFRFAFGTHVLTIPLELWDGKYPRRKPANPEGSKSNGRAKPPKGSDVKPAGPRRR